MNNKNLISDLLLFAIRQVIIIGLATLSNVIMMLFFTPEDFGVLNLWNNGLVFIAIFTDVTFFSPIVSNNISPNRAEKIKYFKYFSLLFVFFCLTLFGVGMLITEGSSRAFAFLFLSFLLFPLFAGQGFYTVLLQQQMKLKEIAIAEALGALGQFLILILFLKLGHGLYAVFFSWLARLVIILFFLLYFYDSNSPSLENESNLSFLELIKQGAKNQVAQLLSFMRGITNPIFIGTFVNLSEIGRVDRVIYFASVPTTILNQMSLKVLFSYFSKLRNNDLELRKYLKRYVLIFSTFDKFLYVPLVILAETIQKKYLHGNWGDFSLMLGLMCIGNSLLSGAFSVFNALLLSRSYYGFLALFSLVQTVLFVVLSLIFTMMFGVWGYLFVCIFQWVGTIYIIFYVSKNIISISVLNEMIVPFLCSIFTIVVFFILHKNFIIPNFYLDVVIYGISSCLFYLFLIYFCLLLFFKVDYILYLKDLISRKHRND